MYQNKDHNKDLTGEKTKQQTKGSRFHHLVNFSE